MVDFHQDEEGHWVADLACGHTQHVRHRPPWELRPWVVDKASRQAHLGHALDCPYCDLPTLPKDLTQYKTTPVFSEKSVPQGLLRAHRTKTGTWARVSVLEGKLLYGLEGGPSWVLTPKVSAIVEPESAHFVTPIGKVRFEVQFFRKHIDPS